MGAYLLRRLLRTIIVLWGVSTIVFFVTRLSGDPITLLLPADAPREEVERVRSQFGLDQALPVQYGVFLRRAVVGDFGQSIRQRQPAMRLALDRMPATLQLAVLSFLFAALLGVPLGIVAGVRPRSAFDNVTMTFALVGQAVPTFYLGILLILFFAVRLGWLPVGGRGDWQTLVLPVVTLGTYALASIARLTRSTMLDVMGQDYIRTARAKGLAGWLVVLRHGFRNALIPVVTIMGLQFGTLLGGAVVTETIFSWPGLGLLAINGIRNRDYPVVQAAVFLAAVAFVVINLLVDLLYSQLDPRIRYS
jgi:ABC-type dipeptide/oligopeptide/nickel transport system permease component